MVVGHRTKKLGTTFTRLYKYPKGLKDYTNTQKV